MVHLRTSNIGIRCSPWWGGGGRFFLVPLVLLINTDEKGCSYVLGHDCTIVPSLGDRFDQRIHTRRDDPHSSAHGCGSGAHLGDSGETHDRKTR